MSDVRSIYRTHGDPWVHSNPNSAEFDPKPDVAYITKYQSAAGRVAKEFTWTGNEVKIVSQAQIYGGNAVTLRANDPAELKQILDGLAANEAIGLGVLPTVNQTMPLVTKKHLRAGAIARTSDFLSYNEGHGFGLIDADTKDLPESVLSNVTCSNIIGDILRVVPELNSVGHLIRPSSSAGIIDPHGQSRPATGYHLFFQMEYSPHLPHLLQIMHDRCWVAGLGYFKLSKSGQVLERSPIDLSVAGPERLIFEAPPIVNSPLTRQRPPDRLMHGGLLDALDAPDQDLVEHLKQQAKDAFKPAATQKAKEYEVEQVEKICAKSKVSKTEARRIFRQRMQGCEFSDGDVLETSPGIFERVGDFLDRVKSTYGMPCPIEGSDYGPSNAAFYPSGFHGPEPRIISYAHGVKTYFHFERYRHLRGLRWLPNQ